MRKIAFSLLIVFVFLIPLENSIIIPGIGRVSRAFGLLVGVFWVGTVIATGRVRQLRPFHLAFFLFTLWHLVTVLWSVNPDTTLSRAATYVQHGLFLWILWDLCLTEEAIRAALQAYVLGASVSIINTLSNYLAGISRGSTPRYTATGFNPNTLAMLLVLGLPIAWYLVLKVSERNKLQNGLRVINYAYLPVAVFAILLTASRTALFSMVPVILFMLASYTRLRLATRLIIAIGLIATFFSIHPLLPQATLDRLSTTLDEVEGGDLSGRVSIWEEGLKQFREQPLLGNGGGTFVEAVQFRDKSAHNMYLNLLVETGLIGLMLLALVVGIAVYHARYLPAWESGLWLTLVVAWAITNTTLSWEVKKQTWLILGLIVAHANVIRVPARIPQSYRVLFNPQSS